jgi:hypothetical protein
MNENKANSIAKSSSPIKQTRRYLKYAIGEIILVMLGILLALQVSNWNNTRLERIKEQSLLNSLHKEFKANKIQLDTIIFYHNKVDANCRKLIDMFPLDTERDNLDSVSEYLRNALFSYTFNPSQGSINSIINSSSFDIIQNGELREILVSWQDLLLDLQEDELNSRDVVFNQIDPFLAPHIDFDINLKDERNNLKVLETLHFEYLIKLKLATLGDILKQNGELGSIKKKLNRIIELTEPKAN